MTITIKVVSSNPAHAEVHPIQQYVIKFVNYLPQVGGFLQELRFPPPETDRHDIIDILPNVALNPYTNPIFYNMQIGGFVRFPPTIKRRHDIPKILLQVA